MLEAAPQRTLQHDGERNEVERLQQVHADLTEPEQRTGDHIEDVRARLLDVPDVSVEHVSFAQRLGDDGRERLVGPERERQVDQRDECDDAEHRELEATRRRCRPFHG
jgi:hypothetical protein